MTDRNTPNDTSDDWKTVNNKKKSITRCPKSQSFPRINQNDVKVTEIFSRFDENEKNWDNENRIGNDIFKESIDQELFDEALSLVCRRYNLDPTDWWAQTEAWNMAVDKKMESMGLKTKFSITLYEPIIVNPDSIPDPKTILLPNTIGLVCEWVDSEGNWKSHTVAIMKTFEDYWGTLRTLWGKNDEDSKFSLPLSGKENEACEIFSKLMNAGIAGKDGDSVIYDKSLRKTKSLDEVNKYVSKFNRLYPIWSFVKINPETINTGNITVPFIRMTEKSPAINDININLKDTKSNQMDGIRCIDSKFSNGYIPYLVLELASGFLPEEISAIVFSKTIAVSVKGETYYKGFRVRALTSKIDVNTMKSCENYLRNTFIKNIEKFYEKGGYSKCVVKISLPKTT